MGRRRIIQTAARLMMIEDEDVADEVAAIVRDDGITVLTSAAPVRVEPAGGGRLRLTVRTADGERQLDGSHLLSAIGRIPNNGGAHPRGGRHPPGRDSGQILGRAVLGSEGGEIMTMIQVAMLGKLTYTAMADAIFTHRSWPKASTPCSRCPTLND